MVALRLQEALTLLELIIASSSCSSWLEFSVTKARGKPFAPAILGVSVDLRKRHGWLGTLSVEPARLAGSNHRWTKGSRSKEPEKRPSHLAQADLKRKGKTVETMTYNSFVRKRS